MITWIKVSKNGNIKKTNGYYLMHSKEIWLVWIKHIPEFIVEGENYFTHEELFNKLKNNKMSRIFVSSKRMQSQKPNVSETK